MVWLLWAWKAIPSMKITIQTLEQSNSVYSNKGSYKFIKNIKGLWLLNFYDKSLLGVLRMLNYFCLCEVLFYIIINRIWLVNWYLPAARSSTLLQNLMWARLDMICLLRIIGSCRNRTDSRLQMFHLPKNIYEPFRLGNESLY